MSGDEICSSDELSNGCAGVEFNVIRKGEVLPAFVVRYRDVVYAYINRCSHMELKLNFINTDFFDYEQENLICATHGALYNPESGACLGGPCNGTGLLSIPVSEAGGKVTLTEHSDIRLWWGGE